MLACLLLRPLLFLSFFAAVFAATASAPTSRRAHIILSPLPNGTLETYAAAWAALGDPATARGGHTAVLPAYALDPGGGLSLADGGASLERFGVPALRACSPPPRMYGGVALTDDAALALLESNATRFAAQLAARGRLLGLSGWELSYAPTRGGGGGGGFTPFLGALAALLGAQGVELSVAAQGCPDSGGLSCSAAAALPGVLAVTTWDARHVASVCALEALQDLDGDPGTGAGGKWAPQLAPGEGGGATFVTSATFLATLGACYPCVQFLSAAPLPAWPQPPWFWGSVNAFVDTPLQ